MLIEAAMQRQPAIKLDGLINQLGSKDEQPAYNLFDQFAKLPQLQQYFKQLHLYATCHHLSTFSRYETLPDGLYILLKGSINYRANKRLANRQNQKRSKSYGIKDSYSILISESYTVFDCSFKNCTTIEDSCLLKIPPELAASTCFQEGRQRRKLIYENQYLSQDHYLRFNIPECSRVFSVDLRIHSNFSFATYSFRQVVHLTSPAIISSGRARLKMSDFSSHEFDQFGVLLPNLRYEVISSSLELMLVRNNQSLTYAFSLNLLKNSKKDTKLKKQNQYSKQSSLTFPQPQYSQQENIKRKKEYLKLSKHIEAYSIFPTFLCTRKFQCEGQLLSKLKRKKVDFNELNDFHKVGEENAQKSEKTIKSTNSPSVYQSSGSLSTKYSRFHSKTKITDGHLLAKIKDHLANRRQPQKSQSTFTQLLDHNSNESRYIGCYSEQ